MTSGLVACSAEGEGEEPTPAPPGLGETPNKADATVTDAARDSSIDRAAPPQDAKADASVAVDANVSDARDGAAADGSADVGASDAGADEETGSATTGSPCAPANKVDERVCGRCGTQQRLCWLSDDDAGGATWLDWGPCLHEKADGGVANSTVNVPCRMCGTITIAYDNQCNASVGFCNSPASAVCEPGAEDSVAALSCDAGFSRSRTCQNDCTWSSFGECSKIVNSANTSTMGTLDGNAGTPSTGRCAAGEALVGFRLFDHGGYVGGLVPVCARLLSAASGAGPITTGATTDLALQGFPAGSLLGASLCPADQVVVGITGRAGWRIDALAVRCAALSQTAAAISVGAATTQASVGGAGGSPIGNYDCPPDMVASIAVVSTWSSYSSVTLTCRTPTPQ